jgi:hypothetical protein
MFKINPVTGRLDLVNKAGSGALDAAKEIVTSVQYGETLSALKLVYIASDGKAYLATSQDTYEKALVAGITKTAGVENSINDILVFGRIDDPSFSYSGTQELFLTTLGNISNIPPAAGIVAFVAKSLNTGSIFINFKHIINLS